MSLNFKAAWGIELGNSSISAVKIQMVKNDPQIVSHFIAPYDSPIENEEEFHDKTSQALTQLVAEAGIKKSEAIVTSLPGRSVFARPVTLPPMDAKRIPELIKYEASQQIPFPIEEVVWDYHVIPSEEPAEEISATIFAVRREEIEELIAIYTEAGLQLQGVQTSPLALLNFIRFDRSPEKPCILIDVKSSNIDFIIHNEGHFWQRNIARGGNDINKALMAKFKIPFTQAEELKRSIESNQQAAKILQVIQPIFKNMTNEIQRSTGHYRSQHEGVHLAHTLLLGNSIRMPKLVDHFTKTLRTEIHKVTKLGKLSKNCADLEKVNKELPSLTVPISLALQGVGAASVALNLIPPDVIARRVQAKKIPWLIAASLIFIVGGLLYQQAVSQANATLEEISSKPKKALNKLKKQVEEIQESKDLIKPGREGLFRWRKLLRDSETLFPRDAHVYALDALHQALYRETTQDRELIFIENLKISKKVPNKDDQAIKKVKGLPELDKAEEDTSPGQVFWITLTGTFFKQPGGRPENLNHVENRIIEPLNNEKEVFFDWTSQSLEDFSNPDDPEIPMQKFRVSGYFLPEEYKQGS